jgi:hypothetical protein
MPTESKVDFSFLGNVRFTKHSLRNKQSKHGSRNTRKKRLRASHHTPGL